MSTNTQKCSESQEKDDEESNHINFTLCKRKISICKPLLLLKVCLFLYYGAGSFMAPFLTVLFKERGVSLNALSVMLMLSPLVQAFITTISGIVADKIGRAKPVFVANAFLTVCLVLSIILLPNARNNRDMVKKLEIACDKNQTVNIENLIEVNREVTELISCVGYDPFDLDGRACKDVNNVTLNLKHTDLQDGNASQSRVLFPNGDSLQSWCSKEKQCIVSCQLQYKIEEFESNRLLIAYGCIYVLFLSTFSTAYRCLDVTVMFMVKEHNSSFGHERFFAVLGMVITSPIAGLIADITAPSGSKRNYTAALYFFIALLVCIVPFIYKMPMKVRPKGENMWKKSIKLCKNPDVLSFFLIIIVLGAGFNLVKNYLFWYLEGLKASSLLIGLITSVNALYGLPFLLTSHWWVKKIGAPQIFVLACVGYALNGVGYSLIQNPWYALGLESTGILTYYLLWVAAVEYSHDIAPEGLTATIISIAGGLHYSVGKVSSGLIGRFIMNSYGGAFAFRVFAAITLSAGALYTVFLCIRRKHHKEYIKNAIDAKTVNCDENKL